MARGTKGHNINQKCNMMLNIRDILPYYTRDNVMRIWYKRYVN